jgi:hypothetical protein
MSSKTQLDFHAPFATILGEDGRASFIIDMAEEGRGAHPDGFRMKDSAWVKAELDVSQMPDPLVLIQAATEELPDAILGILTEWYKKAFAPKHVAELIVSWHEKPILFRIDGSVYDEDVGSDLGHDPYSHTIVRASFSVAMAALSEDPADTPGWETLSPEEQARIRRDSAAQTFVEGHGPLKYDVSAYDAHPGTQYNCRATATATGDATGFGEVVGDRLANDLPEPGAGPSELLACYRARVDIRYRIARNADRHRAGRWRSGTPGRAPTPAIRERQAYRSVERADHRPPARVVWSLVGAMNDPERL